jgi:hypothetical protein
MTLSRDQMSRVSKHVQSAFECFYP